MNDRILLDGSPVPTDRSHTEINPATGMQKNYIVLTPEERAKGFIKPVRRTYVHKVCGAATTMGIALAETYARNPRFFSGTFCVNCKAHFSLNQFHWDDSEPMDPDLQEAWNEERSARAAREQEEYRVNRIAALKRELAELEGAAPSGSGGTK